MNESIRWRQDGKGLTAPDTLGLSGHADAGAGLHPSGADGDSPPSLTGESPSGAQVVEALARLADEAIGGAQVFGTWTFRDPSPRPGSPLYTSVGHGGGVRAMTRYLVGLGEVYPGLAAFVAMEPHADRVAPHFHGLLGGLDADVPPAIERGRRLRPVRQAAAPIGSVGARQARARMWEAWYQEHGIARLEAVHGNGAGLYVAKYSLKGASEVPWWRIWEPGELRNRWVADLHKRRPR